MSPFPIRWCAPAAMAQLVEIGRVTLSYGLARELADLVRSY
jgi:hypothetical protein